MIKICANPPDTYRALAGDMDVNAGDIIEGGRRTIEQVGREIRDLVISISNGIPSASEALGHREFILTYKTFEPIGPACLPSRI